MDCNVHGPPGDHAENAPGQEGFDGPGEVVMQTGYGDIGAGVGKINGPQDIIFDDALARVEVPAKESINNFGNNLSFTPFFGTQKVVVNNVATMHRLRGIVV